MGKEEFNKLKVKDQVEYINQKLDKKSLTEICKDINISRATVRKRFLKQGYVFNKNNNKYIYSSEENNEAQKENKHENNTKVLEEKIQVLESKIEAIENKLNNNYKYIYSSEENNEAQKENKHENNTKVLEEKIQVLESKIEAIENKLNNNFSGVNIKKFEGKTVSRCYRLYEEVQKEFSKFCKENSNYKVQDILSMALYEYMKDYKL